MTNNDHGSPMEETLDIEIERKFLLAAAPERSDPRLSNAEITHIEQVYIEVTDTTETRIRRTRHKDGVTYHYTQLRSLKPGKREVVEKEISRTEYEDILAHRDPRRQPITKDRYYFTWKSQVFELDKIYSPASRACHILEIQLSSEDQAVILPDFLNIERDVTGEAAYSNANIALG